MYLHYQGILFLSVINFVLLLWSVKTVLIICNLFLKNFVGAGHHVKTSLTGTTVGVDVSGSEKIWKSFQAIGDIAFAYAYSTVLIEIQASTLSLILILIFSKILLRRRVI